MGEVVMAGFIFRRFLALIPLLLGITFLVFVLMNLAEGDFLTQFENSRDHPKELIEELREGYGLDKPVYVQYLLWLGKIFQGDLGYSFQFKTPVAELIGTRMLSTFLLSLSALLFSWCIAIPLGVLAAVYKDSVFDRLSALLAYAALSIPEFFLGLMLVFLAAQTGWFPLGGATSIGHDYLGFWGQLWDRLYHLLLPTVALGIGSVASIMRIMRSNFLDVIRSDFVTTARAKGLQENVIMFKHVLRNAINPLVSAFGFAFSSLLSGALIVEIVLQYPGLGTLMYESLLREDVFVVLASVLLSCTMLVVGNLISDILLAWSDPRIRLGGGRG